MPLPSKPLSRLGFLTIGLFDGADPRPGHESTLEIIQLGEQLGFDSAWVRHRHLQYGISSPVAILAAASQRTSRIELGTAVIPRAALQFRSFRLRPDPDGHRHQAGPGSRLASLSGCHASRMCSVTAAATIAAVAHAVRTPRPSHGLIGRLRRSTVD